MIIEPVIWQYWETKDSKPSFVDGLYEIVKKNSGAKVILVTPDNIHDYLPNAPHHIFEIEELAHKADMIRTLLVYQYGGMWMDSDAIVLSNLDWMFRLLKKYDFVGFNGKGFIDSENPKVRINCFLSNPKSIIMKDWVNAQHNKFPKIKYSWNEVGTDILDSIIMKYRHKIKLLPFDLICPIRWNQVSKFSSKLADSRKVLKTAQIVMLSNKSLHSSNQRLTKMSLNELAEGDDLIADIIKRALDPGYIPASVWKKIFNYFTLTNFFF